MKIKSIILIILAVIVLAAIIFMLVPKPVSECDPDIASSCVKATCCHATSCIAAEKAPNCSNTMCTQECEPNTLDCGGSCSCEQGKCTAKEAQ